MPEIEGILQRARKTTGWLSDLKIVVDEKEFYKRMWPNDKSREIRAFIGTVKQHVGEKVKITYEERVKISTDTFVEKILMGNLSVPKKYNEIISIKYLDEQ